MERGSAFEGFCLCRTSMKRSMTAGEGDCLVQVVNAFSDECLCTLQLPRYSTVLEVKRRVHAAQGISAFRQRLIISPAGPEVEGNEVLADLPGLRLS